jgi:hypothetical protein
MNARGYERVDLDAAAQRELAANALAATDELDIV